MTTLRLWYSVPDLVTLGQAHAGAGLPASPSGWYKLLAGIDDARLRRARTGKGGGWQYHLLALPAAAQSLLMAQAHQGAASQSSPQPIDVTVPAPRRRGRPAGTSAVELDQEVRDLAASGLEVGFSAKVIRESIVARLGADRAPALRTLQWWVTRYRRDHGAELALQVAPNRYRSHFRPAVGSVSAGVEAVNALWEMDTTPTDIILADGRRHAVLGVIDVYSRRQMYLLARTSTSRAVAALIRKAILAWGAPLAIKMDNGADYVSAHIRTALESLDIEQRLCTPGSPWEKPHVERALGAFSHDLLPGLPGYVGHDVATRKEIEERRKELHGPRRLQARAAAEVAMDAEAFATFLDQCAISANTRLHASLGTTPELHAAACRAPRRVIDPRALDLLLMPVGGWRTVGKRHITLSRRHYSAPELVAWKGRQVRVRVDDADLGRVYVFDQRDTYICEAIDPLWLGVSQAEHTAAVNAAERRWKRDVNEAARARRARVKPETIARDVLANRVAEAAQVLAFPKPVETHATPATEAVRAASLPRHERTAEQANRLAEARARFGDAAPQGRMPQGGMLEGGMLEGRTPEVRQPATVARIDPGRQRLLNAKMSFERAMEIVGRVKAGQPVDPSELAWVGRYGASSEFGSQVRLRKFNGELPSDWQLPEDILNQRKKA